MKEIIRSDWSGTKPGEKQGPGILRYGVFKNTRRKANLKRTLQMVTLIVLWAIVICSVILLVYIVR